MGKKGCNWNETHIYLKQNDYKKVYRMKKLCSLMLIMALILSAIGITPVSAEETHFVIDGQLDPYYRDDAWAIANNCYFYYDSFEDTTLLPLSRRFDVTGQPPLLLEPLKEEIKIKLYVAYDDQYAYFFVDVNDPIIATTYTDYTGVPNDAHPLIENIDFYIDTDPLSATGSFQDNLDSQVNADTHFRLIAHNLAVTDAQTVNDKYIFMDQPMYDPTKIKNADNYFRCDENMVAIKKTDSSGRQIGYTCEVRVPLAHGYAGHEHYSAFYYNIAVTNSATNVDSEPCAITTGYRWWLAYDTGKLVTYDKDPSPNPFFHPVNEDQIAADKVNTMINQLTDPDAIEPWETYTVKEAIDQYDALTEEQRALIDPIAYDKLVACAKAVHINWPDNRYGDVDGNGKVEATDALEVLKSVVGKVDPTDEQLIVADTDGNGKADATDALNILKKVVGKIDKFPVEE